MSNISEKPLKDFGTDYSNLDNFLKNQNQVALSNAHKFVYGIGQEMTSSQLLNKLESLAETLKSAHQGSTIAKASKEKISTLLSSISQLSFAKLEGKIATSKKRSAIKSRINQIDQLAKKLGIETSRWVPLPRESSVIMKKDLTDPVHPNRKMLLEHFSDNKVVFTSEEIDDVSKLNLSQRRSDALRVSQSTQGSSSSLSTLSSPSKTTNLDSISSSDAFTTSSFSSRSGSSSLASFEVQDLPTIQEQVRLHLSERDQEYLIGQMHQTFCGKTEPAKAVNFTDQVIELSKVFQQGEKKDSARILPAHELIAKLIFDKSSPTTLFTSINVLGRDVRFINDKEKYLTSRAEISQVDGQPQIEIILQGNFKSNLASNNKPFKEMDTSIDVTYNPISGKHFEKITLQ